MVECEKCGGRVACASGVWCGGVRTVSPPHPPTLTSTLHLSDGSTVTLTLRVTHHQVNSFQHCAQCSRWQSRSSHHQAHRLPPFSFLFALLTIELSLSNTRLTRAAPTSLFDSPVAS